MLRAFRHDDESLAGEWEINGLSLADLQQLFGLSDDDPMYGSVPVGDAQAGPLGHATGVSIDLAQYAYFVDTDAV